MGGFAVNKRKEREQKREEKESEEREERFISFTRRYEENEKRTKEIRERYIQKSWEEELPYPCVNKIEFEAVQRLCQGDNSEKEKLIALYRSSREGGSGEWIYPDEEKADYWENRKKSCR